MRKHKYIFVLGGVMSGVGKGVTASSIGKILQSQGYKINPLKIDPYLNVDAGTMNPIEHGEVFVLDSGLECDQDMGNYERFLDISVPPENYMTSGMVYKYVIDKERALGYGGRCVDPVPFICEEIFRRIDLSVKKTGADITIIEIGGTVGEYQNSMFVEAARVLKLRRPGDVLFALVSYLPVPNKIGEMKTKPTQYAVQTMNSYGVHPDIIIARADRSLDMRRKEKIAFMSNIPTENIISAPDIESIYDIPLNFEKDNLGNLLLKSLGLKSKKSDLQEWEKMTKKVKSSKEEVKIAIVGKYFKTGDFVLSDVYLSVIESLKHAGANLGKKVKIDWLDSHDYELSDSLSTGELTKNLKELKKYQGILVPGGFGERGIEGKIRVIQFARENKIPYFGLCYGMQLAVIEFARHVLGLKDAHTTEINPETSNPVVVIMDEQRKLMADKNYGGTMRLGAYPCVIKAGTIAEEAYKNGHRLEKGNKISERHRHRFEVNPVYIEKLTKAGLVFPGISPDGILMEIAELPRKIHPFFLGTQFHPEFKSSPLNPHPLFVEFIKSASKQK